MIQVKHLTKRYGSHEAVSDLSFEIEKGRIYGFLGPNGAGKSTTMNIITGCLGASEGEVLVGGHSIMEDPIAAKKLIGYLPEQPPLYVDMTVEEYLRFVAEAKSIPAGDRTAQVAAVMERTAVTEMKDRLIRNLSKGYRQRVGIAQALLGDPEIIILDEPTVGLDPAKIIEIRELIRSLGENHTVILSSHILSEVQAVCDSIMIISRGKMVAGDTPENLTRLFAGKTTIHLEIAGSPEETARALEGLGLPEGALTVTEGEGFTAAEIAVPGGSADLRAEVFRAFADAGVPLLEMHTVRASLEEVFLELTGDHEEPAQTKKRGFRFGRSARPAAEESAENPAPAAAEAPGDDLQEQEVTEA